MKKRYRFDIKLMMADCEANYARLCRILPSIYCVTVDNQPDSRHLDIDLAIGKPAKLILTIRERCRFTTMVDIEVLVESFCDEVGRADCVKMSVRLYHDVNMAEVVACNQQLSHLASYEYPNKAMFQPDEKAQQNRFLGEWLGLCLQHGMIPNSAYQDVTTADTPLSPSVSEQADSFEVRPSSYRQAGI